MQKILTSAIFLISFLSLGIPSVQSASVLKGTPTIPGESCQVDPHHSWTPQEKWVWDKLCSGEEANFNKADKAEGFGGRLDPRRPEEWPENRILTPAFLETILLYEPYRGSIPHQGVQIVGAWFKDKIDLSNVILIHNLVLVKSRFESDVNLSSLKSSYLIFFSGSKFNKKLNMSGLQVDDYLSMSNAEFAEVVLLSAKVGELSMTGSKFNKKLDMSGLLVDKQLFMRFGAEFNEVLLMDAKVGVLNMTGSKFNKKLEMTGLQVDRVFFMSGAEFTDVVLIGAKIGQLEMISSTFKGKVDMSGLHVDKHLLMNKAVFDEVVLRTAHVGGSLEMNKSKFIGKLDMKGLQVNGDLEMSGKAEFAEVLLRSAKIGLLNMSSSKFNKKLDMSSLQVDEHLAMNHGAEFAEVVLRNAHVGGSLEMSGSTFNGKLFMYILQIDENLQMNNKTVFKMPVDILSSKINLDLYISNSTFLSLDLSNTQINGEFTLGSGMHPRAIWGEKSKLTLRNTKVGVLQDLEDAWPNDLELTGFIYSSLGGYTAGEKQSMDKRGIKWLKQWLEKQKYYSPQPYEQLAQVLNEAGFKDKARNILYENKSRERRNTTSIKSRLWLFLQFIFIGYGYDNFRVIYWIIFLCGLGTCILHKTGEDVAHKMKYWGFAYSIDMLLPIIELYKPHYNIQIDGKVRVYFYVHKIFGYILASFLIAGLSGLTK